MEFAQLDTSCGSIQNCSDFIEEIFMEELPEYRRVVEKRNRDIKLNPQDLKILSQVNEYFDALKAAVKLEDTLNLNYVLK